jgi:hypothetical protein
MKVVEMLARILTMRSWFHSMFYREKGSQTGAAQLCIIVVVLCAIFTFLVA